MGLLDRMRRRNDTTTLAKAANPYAGAPAGTDAALRAAGMDTAGPFAPGRPLTPYAGYGGLARAWNMPTGYNIISRPQRDSRVSFEILKQLTTQYDIARMCIGHRIDDVRSLGFAITAKRGYTGDADAVVDQAEQILEYPEGPGGTLPFHAWIAKYLEDVLRYDAGALLRRRDRAGRVIGLKVISGTTIAPVLDYWGDTPTGDAPAYVQFVNGTPWKWLTTSDLIYVPFRPQPDSPYGFAPLEAVLINANTDLRFQMHFLKWFTAGTVPEGFASAPENIDSPKQLGEWQAYWDATMYGDDDAKHQLKFVPHGTTFEWSKSTDFNPEFPLYLMRKTAAAYHITPNDLGWTETVNRATADTQVDVQFRIGTLPLVEHVERILNTYLQRDRGLPVEFHFDTGQEKEDRLAEAQTWGILVDKGAASPDEMRAKLTGLPINTKRPTPRFYSTPRIGPVPLLAIEGVAGKTDPETYGPADDQPVLDQPFVPAIGVVPPPGTADDQASLRATDTAEAAERRELDAAHDPDRETPAAQQQRGTRQQPAATTAATDAAPAAADGAVAKTVLSGAEAAELAQFRRFAKQRERFGEWRDFTFTAVDPAVAAELNRGGRDAVLAKAKAAADGTARAVYDQLAASFPPDAIRWVLALHWTGPQDVPLEDVDFSDEATWAASHEPGRVDKTVRKIRAGKRVKPAVLVARPGHGTAVIADGHHRAKGAQRAGVPLRAYVGHATTDTGPWNEMHSSQQVTKGGTVPGLTKRSGMISLDLEPGTIPVVSDGVDDHHITIVYLGPDVDDQAFAAAVDRARVAAATLDGPVPGTVHGVDTFPPSAGSKGTTPAFANVDLPAAQQLRAELADLSASEHTDYHPHVTLKYLADGEPAPDPVPSTPVTFTHLSVHRGPDVIRIPLGPPDGDVAKAAGDDDPKDQAPDDQGPTAPAWPGWGPDLEAAGHWAPLIAAALLAGINTGALARNWLAHHATTPAGDPDTLRTAAEQWIRTQGIDTHALTETVRGVTTDGYLIGSSAARAEQAAAPIDLGHWTPGDRLAAEQLLGERGDGTGLRAMLDRDGIVIKSIVDTRVEELGRLLADAAAAGDHPDDVADRIRDLLENPRRARQIAITELSRASDTASLAYYRSIGLTHKQWLDEGDTKVCPICEANAAAGLVPIDEPYPSGDMNAPAHPECRCASAGRRAPEGS